jgi:CBS domain-containing protein
MKVKEVMVEEVKVCSTSDTLNRAAQIMWENDCGCVPVISEESRLVGVLTDRDICMAAYTQGATLGGIPVSSVMSQELFACRPSDDLSAAQRIMREHRVRRLPVTDAEAKLIGIVSLTDIARAVSHSGVGKAKVADTLVAVCTPHRIAATPQSTLLQPRGDEPRRRTRRSGASNKEPKD